MSQLTTLAKPFADTLIQSPPKGKYGSYVSHDVVTQKLLLTLGPFSMHIVELTRGRAAEIQTKDKTYPAVENAVVGCILRCTFTIDGREVTIEEVGDVEAPAMKETDGARAKDAVSDAIKRAAMRVGCGLHLWSGKDYILYDQLLKAQPSKEVSSGETTQPSPSPKAGSNVSPDSSQGSAGTRGQAEPSASAARLPAEKGTPVDAAAPATSSQTTKPEKTKGASSSERTEGLPETSVASSSATHLLETLRADKPGWTSALASKSAKAAMEASVRPPLNWRQLLDTPEIHEAVAKALGLAESQGSLV